MRIRNVGVVCGKRTPVGVIGGALRQVPSPLLLSSVISAVLGGVPLSLISSAVFGCSLQGNLGINPVKQALSLSKVENIPSYLINTGHSGGLDSVLLACQSIQMGEDLVLCGGFDSSSNCPHSIQGRNSWKSGENVKDELQMAYYTSKGMHYGLALEELIVKLQISRRSQESYAAHAQKRRKIALKTGVFEKEIQGLEVLNEDELVFYPENQNFKPIFYSTGSISAVCTAWPSDGAVALLLGSLSTIQKFHLSCLASVSAVWKANLTDISFYTTVETGVKKILNLFGLAIHNIDLWEINDFFALIPTVLCEKLGIDLEKVNITGGNLSIGDTFSASSARSVLTASLQMELRQAEFSVLISLNCSNEVVIVLLRSSNLTHN